MVKDPVVILANGNYPTHPIPVKKLHKASCIVCCNGAAGQLTDKGLEPSIIIGDLDSIDQTLKSKYNDKTIHLPGQDANDLRKAIQWVENGGGKEAIILGATGKRNDHSLSNIFIMLQFPTSLKCTLITDYGCFKTAEGTEIFKSFKGQQVSLFSTDPEIEITSKRLKYNLISTKLNDLYSGSLNESIGESFTLCISHGKILVYQVFE